MTDITALPTVTPEMLASLKLSAMNLAEGEMMSFEPAVFRALVEALEKAQFTIETQKSEISHFEYRLKNVQDAHRYWAERALKTESVPGQLFIANKRIAELESRTVTVKLPDRKTAGDYIDDAFDSSDLAAVHNACRLQCRNTLAAAGIQVIEGETKA